MRAVRWNEKKACYEGGVVTVTGLLAELRRRDIRIWREEERRVVEVLGKAKGYKIDLGSNQSIEVNLVDRKTDDILEDYDLSLYADPATYGDYREPLPTAWAVNYIGADTDGLDTNLRAFKASSALRFPPDGLWADTENPSTFIAKDPIAW